MDRGHHIHRQQLQNENDRLRAQQAEEYEKHYQYPKNLSAELTQLHSHISELNGKIARLEKRNKELEDLLKEKGKECY